jgi:hypothetical protein
MMAGSTTWLGREVDRVATEWMQHLGSWQPFADSADTAADRQICSVCIRFARHLQLDETPHHMLHALAAPIDKMIAECYGTIANERYEHLLDRGWSFGLEDGIVRVVSPGGEEVVAIFKPREWDEGDTTDDPGEVRFQLIMLYADVLGIAVGAVLQRHAAITRAVRATVEPAVASMTHELISEICGP